jgi:hypothetical protein
VASHRPLRCTSDRADELAKLADKITSTEEELKEVKDVIKTIRTGGDAAVEALGYGERSQAQTHLQRLETEKEQLRALLLQYETRLNAQQQQQQSGAGTSMLLVRQEAARLSNVLLHTPAVLVAFQSHVIKLWNLLLYQIFLLRRTSIKRLFAGLNSVQSTLFHPLASVQMPGLQEKDQGRDPLIMTVSITHAQNVHACVSAKHRVSLWSSMLINARLTEVMVCYHEGVLSSDQSLYDASSHEMHSHMCSYLMHHVAIALCM